MPESKNKKEAPLDLVKSNTFEMRTKENLVNKAECSPGTTSYKWQLDGVTVKGKSEKIPSTETTFAFGPDTTNGMLEAGNYMLNLTITYANKETSQNER